MEQVDSSVVGKEDPLCEAIKQLAIGDITPQEDEVTEVVVPQVLLHQFPLTYLIVAEPPEIAYLRRRSSSTKH